MSTVVQETKSKVQEANLSFSKKNVTKRISFDEKTAPKIKRKIPSPITLKAE